MGHVDGLFLFLNLVGAVDADRDGQHHVAPPFVVFSPLRCCREADTVCSWDSYLRVAAQSCQAVSFPLELNRGHGQWAYPTTSRPSKIRLNFMTCVTYVRTKEKRPQS